MPLTRLLLINYEYPPLGGGAATATAALAREFARRGLEVTVLTSAFRGLPPVTRDGTLTVRRVPTWRRHPNQSNVLEMIVFMLSAGLHVLARSNDRPEATLAFFGIPGAPVAWWLKALREVPYVISLRGGDVPGHQPNQLARHHRLTRPLITFLWRRARAVVANSEGLRREALLHMPTLNIPVIPNGVDTRHFVPRAAPLPTPPTTCQLLFVGRLSAEKGLAGLLTVLARLTHLPWSLRLVGEGPERPALEAQAQTLALQSRVTFSGWVAREQLPACYQAAELFVFPSTDEGMPNTVLEAMACGLPVVAMRIAGCEDLVVDGETGMLLPPGDDDALAKALDALLTDSARRTRYGTAARQRVEHHFAWARAADAYLAILQPRP